MGAVKAIVISGNGVNCEREVAHACTLGGADQVDIVHIAELIAGRVRLDDYHFLNLVGGFQDGDDLGSAKAGANRIKHVLVETDQKPLVEQFLKFIADGKLVMGVCNGFQLMVKAGLLPAVGGDYRQQEVTLTFNSKGRFEDRWVSLKIDKKSPCVFTKGIENMYLPIRHGEGRFVVGSDEILSSLEDNHLSVMKYAMPDFSEATQEYPYNPNGSVNSIAAVCDPTGRVFGMMPHPEAYLHRTNHPRWTREELPEEGMGLWLYRNAVDYIRENLV